MDSRRSRILLQNHPVLLGRIVPFSLRLEGLGVELERLLRLGCGSGQFRRGAGREIRVRVHGQVKNFRIFGEFAIQETKKVLSRIRLIGQHPAAYASKAHAALEIFVSSM